MEGSLPGHLVGEVFWDRVARLPSVPGAALGHLRVLSDPSERPDVGTMTTPILQMKDLGQPAPDATAGWQGALHARTQAAWMQALTLIITLSACRACGHRRGPGCLPPMISSGKQGVQRVPGHKMGAASRPYLTETRVTL